MLYIVMLALLFPAVLEASIVDTNCTVYVGGRLTVCVVVQVHSTLENESVCYDVLKYHIETYL